MLYFRFPREEPQSLNGNFVSTESIENHQFVVSNFNQEFSYFWSEDAIATQTEQAAPFCIDQAAYIAQAEQLIKDLDRGIADKIVLSRIKKSEQTIADPFHLYEQLLLNYPNALVYYFHEKCF